MAGKRTNTALACVWGAMASVGIFCPPAAGGELEAIDAATPWRVWLVHGPNLLREQGELKAQDRGRTIAFDPGATGERQGDREKRLRSAFSPLPPTVWANPDSEVHHWPWYLPEELFDYLGDYGAAVEGHTWATLLCLRTRFGVASPPQATDLDVTVACIGGAAVYVNGVEVGRGFLPAGEIHPLTPATDYPIRAYAMEDGSTPLPGLRRTSKPEAKWLGRYEQRIRTFTVRIPCRALRKGANVLAVAIHRSAVAGPLDRRTQWNHLGFRRIALTSASGAGVIPYAKALRGARVWSAAPVDQVTADRCEESLIRRSMFKTFIWSRGMWVKGVQVGNPFDPLRPIRMAVPRNGVTSGQAVLSDLAGLRGVKAVVSPLRGPGGAAISPDNVQVRCAVQHAAVHYCDVLVEHPPEGAKTTPVWLIVRAARDQTPGWYTGSMKLSANGKSFDVPVQVLVTGYTLPAARDFASDIGVAHSPDTTAAHYKVKAWSDAHFRLMEPSMRMMGQLGNDVLHVPVITANHFNWKLPLVRFTKTPHGLRPELTLLSRYLDLYAKHCAAPKAVCLYVWDTMCAKRVANSYEGRQIPSRQYTPKAPLTVQVVDPDGTTREVEAPHIGDPEGERFYKALIDGVRGILKQRRWPERSLMLGLGGDKRPSKEDADLIRQWAPKVRWDLLSHFSGDPGTIFHKAGPGMEALAAGKMIAVGGLEVGVKEHPWTFFGSALPAAKMAERLARPTEFMDLGTARWHWRDDSPPLVFRTLPMMWGNLGRIGLDFWISDRDAPRNTSYFTASSALTAPGPSGALSTVRFQMMREGVQDAELRFAILRACDKLPPERRAGYHAQLDELVRRIAWGRTYLSQHELAYNWPDYAAKLQEAAADLAGVRSEARWDRPPR